MSFFFLLLLLTKDRSSLLLHKEVLVMNRCTCNMCGLVVQACQVILYSVQGMDGMLPLLMNQ